jgi:1-acylglycerone phosphate reductase
MPWSGLYSSSKAAIFALSDVLDMEMRPFGVRLLLLCPGAVQSRLADNHGLDVSTLLPSGSLYTSFIACISRRLRITQINALSTERFAQQTVSAALQPTAPRYMSIGAHVWVAWALTWVPRSLRLKLYWDDYQKT